MSTYYLYADAFHYAHEVKPAGYLAIEAGRFGAYSKTLPDTARPEDVLDYRGYVIAPGYVDTHVHGYAGHDVMDASLEGLKAISAGIPETGVTSFLPTTLTASKEALEAASATVAALVGQEPGAKIQGVFFEGPYFTETFKGAQNPAYMKDPSLEDFADFQQAAQGHIRKLALAPERQGVPAFIRSLRQDGVYVALGHSNATYAEAKAAVDAGASIWVHAYNGMRGLSHREPGMVGAMYNLPETTAELICDGHHVEPVACEILLRQKGPDHVALVTDCMRAGGCPDGDYHLGDFPVVVSGGTARLKEGGSLAGSILRLEDGVRNLVNWGLATANEAIRMASYVPAKSVGLLEVCGHIHEGLPADFLVLDPCLHVCATYINGHRYFGLAGHEKTNL